MKIQLETAGRRRRDRRRRDRGGAQQQDPRPGRGRLEAVVAGGGPRRGGRARQVLDRRSRRQVEGPLGPDRSRSSQSQIEAIGLETVAGQAADRADRS